MIIGLVLVGHGLHYWGIPIIMFVLVDDVWILDCAV
jgi:hypothetical protein